MDIRLLRQSLHQETHLLLEQQLGDVCDVGADVVPAVLLLEEAGRTG